MDVDLHFSRSGKINDLGYKAEDYILTREAAYLVAMNGDPNKEAIALEALGINYSSQVAKLRRKPWAVVVEIATTGADLMATWPLFS